MLNEFGSLAWTNNSLVYFDGRPHQLQNAHMHRQCVSICLLTLDKLLSASSIPSGLESPLISTRSQQYYPNLNTDGYILAPQSRHVGADCTNVGAGIAVAVALSSPPPPPPRQLMSCAGG